MSSPERPVLSVENLSISYRVGRRWLPTVREFRVTVAPGEIYGIVGESGSGKSTAATGIMGLLAPNGRVERGSVVRFHDENIVGRSRRDMQHLWGASMGLVPQNPGAALNPSLRVGEQVAETLRHHLGLDHAAARERAIAMFRRVNLADPAGIARRYPHELSGGMQQRVVIALALSTSPHLLILDEPTTALDVTTEAVILDLVRGLIGGGEAGALYVTHNLGVVAHLCTRVIVLYAGEIMEDAAVSDLFARPLHPYTLGLLASIPRLGQTKDRAPLQTIPGRPPSLAEVPTGCVFAPRCPLAIDLCRTRPPLESAGDGRSVRCHRWGEIAAGTLSLGASAPVNVAPPAPVQAESGPLLAARGLTKRFAVPRTLAEVLRRADPAPVRAVDRVDLDIAPGRTFGLVGESGSGKTTLARVIIGLESRDDGTLSLLGIDVRDTVRQRGRDVLAQFQMVFQNPQDSLNPYLTIGQAIRRPLMTLARLERAAADREVARLLRAVNLQPEYARRYPGELSGGEKQRVAIARAFASNPALILCDEPVSSLDVSVQAAVLNVLARLQAERGTSYLFISHDLAVVGYLADDFAVMYLGELFEIGRGADLFAPPYHPYTEALLAAVPRADAAPRSSALRLHDDIPSPRAIPTGCRFHTRCPRQLGPLCEGAEPPWLDAGGGHRIRCHIPPDELAALQRAVVLREEA